LADLEVIKSLGEGESIAMMMMMMTMIIKCIINDDDDEVIDDTMMISACNKLSMARPGIYEQ
jgi:hypothetical protein